MLIEFSVANYRSIKQKQTLSMVSSGWEKEFLGQVISHENKKLPNLVSSAVIYGPNASGKTNLLRALNFMEWFVSFSQQKMQINESIDTVPFRFDTETNVSPSEFEVIFINDGIRYQYGFSADQKHIFDEWLYAYPRGAKQTWFERKFDTYDIQENTQEKKCKYKWNNPALKGSEKTIQEWKNATRDNGLFLAVAIQLNNEQLKPVFTWFQKKLAVIGSIDGLSRRYTAEQYKIGNSTQGILEITQYADPSIVAIEVEEAQLSKLKEFEHFPKTIQEKILNDEKEGKKTLEITCVHLDNKQNPVNLNFREESDGTKNLFAFAGLVLKTLEFGGILVIDEINNSLHPLLVKKIIDLFHNPKVNKNRAQLIFSTHDISILSKEVFRRDQIWFTEKDLANATALFPLTDFKVTKEDSLAKRYLQGRYGAIPYFEGGLVYGK
ncbi:MAG: hypothetical protein A2X78_02495 [Gammaproteobacteria bacterium GWE2_37_16]|nr:MAG: hypothetical protein A2X78_02495 [Gammaproteobacteria bacterium GWE2_37_16]